MNNKQQAQQRADQIVAFQRELERLRQDGIFSPNEAERARMASYHRELLAALSAQFDIDTNVRQKQFSTGMKVASFIGALALAASVFFLFLQFWGYFSTLTQVVILVFSPLLTLGLTVGIARYEHTGYFAKLAAMLSFACFVLNLVLLGDIFSITPSEGALLVWSLYAVLLAYALDVRMLLGVGILALAGFIAARTGTWSGMYWLSVGERPEHFFLPALLIFTTPLWLKMPRFNSFDPIYRVFGALLLMLPILVLSNWGAGSYLSGSTDLIEGVYQSVGFIISAVLIWLGIRYHWNDMVNTGNVFLVLFLYTKVFDWWWESMPKWLFFLLIALITLLMLVVYRRLRQFSQQQEI